MLKIARLWLAPFIVTIGSACGERPLTTLGDTQDPRFKSVLATLEAEMTASGIPGASIAIVEHGKLVAQAGVGFSKHGESQAITPATLFRVASLSKMVLSAAAMKLTEDGRLDLARPVTDYVPLSLAAGFDPSTIRVEHLLTHTAGVPNLSAAVSCPTGQGEMATWFGANGSEPLWTPPGEVWNYSNRGFSIAGWIVETVSGTRYEDFVRANVFGPAKMETATFDPVAARAVDHAVGHAFSSKGITFYEPDAYDCAVTRPPAGVIANPGDYAHFVETLLANGGSMLEPASVAAMETGHADTDQYPNQGEKYGYGFFVRDGYRGIQLLRHEGDDPGYQSAIWIVPDRGFAAIVFYNATGRKPSVVAKAAVDTYLGVAGVSDPDESTPSSTWSRYAGTYVDPFVLGSITVAFENGALLVNAPKFGAVGAKLTQIAGDTFDVALAGKTGSVTFYPDKDGAPRWFVTREGVGERVSLTR